MGKSMMITGADGFFGSRLARHFGETYEVIALNHREFDITCQNQVSEAVKRWKPEVVLHCAAISSTRSCEDNPRLSGNVNVIGTMNLVKACSLTGSRIVFMSSDQVYGGTRNPDPSREDQALIPSGVYGRDKMAAEEVVMGAQPHGICLRLPWMYDLPSGTDRVNLNLPCSIIKAMVHNSPLLVPVHDRRGITWVWEIVEQMDEAINLPGGIYNFGSENSLSAYETAVAFAKCLAPERTDIIVPDMARFAGQPRNLCMDTEKLKAEHMSFHDTVDGFKRCLEAYESYGQAFGFGIRE